MYLTTETVTAQIWDFSLTTNVAELIVSPERPYVSPEIPMVPVVKPWPPSELLGGVHLAVDVGRDIAARPSLAA